MRLLNNLKSIIGKTVYLDGNLSQSRIVEAIHGEYLVLVDHGTRTGRNSGHYSWYSLTPNGPKLTKQDLQ